MKSPIPRLTTLTLATLATLLLAACNSGSATVATPSPRPQPQPEATMTSSSTYPKTGHADDYSWIAGRVTFTKIQGGCIFIFTDPAAIKEFEAALTPQTGPTSTISGPVVGTAVGSDTSPPLRDITPETGAPPTQPPSDRFTPGGPAWDPSKVKDGDYVVLFGRLAGPGDATEICPGGTPYFADKVLPNL